MMDSFVMGDVPRTTVPEIYRGVGLIKGASALTTFADYQAELARYDETARMALDVLSVKDDVLVGSNPFAVVLMNRILNRGRQSVVMPQDVGKIFEDVPELFEDNKVDIGLVLRGEGDDYTPKIQCVGETDKPNDFLSRDLVKKVKGRFGSIKFPALLYLNDLNFAENIDSPYGLEFVLRNEARITHVPELEDKNDGRIFSDYVRGSLPFFNSHGNPIKLFTKDGGLSRMVLCGNNFLYSGLSDLALSDDDFKIMSIKF
jgi:hypothetical protein